MGRIGNNAAPVRAEAYRKIQMEARQSCGFVQIEAFTKMDLEKLAE